MKFEGVSKEKFPETIWYIGLKFSDVTETVILLQYSEISFFFLTLSDYDKPILMRQICK